VLRKPDDTCLRHAEKPAASFSGLIAPVTRGIAYSLPAQAQLQKG
jgi:hypothetical protein